MIVIGLSGAALLLVGKEVAEFVVIDGALKIIGKKAKGRLNQMNISFEAIRNQLNVNTTPVVDVAQVVKTKAVEVAKSVGTVVHNVLPVTNAKLDRELDMMRKNIAAIAARQGLELEHIRGVLGLENPQIPAQAIDALASVLVSAMKIEATAVHAQADIMAIPEPAVALPVTPATVTAPATPAPQQKAPSQPQQMVLPISLPNNWHMGPEV